MTQYRLYDGFDEPDTIAFGLPAAQLMVVVGCALGALLLLRSPIPKFVSVPPALLLAASGAALGWLHWQERPLLEWTILAVRFVARNRGRGILLASEEPTSGPLPSAPEPAPQPTAPVPPQQSRRPPQKTPSRRPRWEQWLVDRESVEEEES